MQVIAAAMLGHSASKKGCPVKYTPSAAAIAKGVVIDPSTPWWQHLGVKADETVFKGALLAVLFPM
jgi:hypothetical protein